VTRGKPKELGPTRSRLPFGNLLAILQLGIENEARTSKHLGTAKIITACLDPTEDLNGGHAVRLRGMVVEPGRIVQGKTPQAGVILIRPMDLDMKEHRTGTANHNADGALSQRILMMGTDPRKRLMLLTTVITSREFPGPLLTSEHTVVAVV